jgi:hypothetical protein
MDTETLERLLMDRALGALPADAEALLAAWVSDHPEKRAVAERIERTVGAARAALAEEKPVRLPPFPVEAIGRRLAERRRWAVVGEVAGLAACVLVGIGLHAAWIAGGMGNAGRAGPGGITKDAEQAITVAQSDSHENAQEAHRAGQESRRGADQESYALQDGGAGRGSDRQMVAGSGPERSGFWSARRWYERSEQRRPESGKRVIWDSPLSGPRFGDAT